MARNLDGNSRSEQTAKGEQKANRDNRKFKNRRKSMSLKEIPKVNRDKSATSASPYFRPRHGQSVTTSAVSAAVAAGSG